MEEYDENSHNEDYEEVEVEEPEEFEEVDLDVIEFSLNEEDINLWISKLEELRERKGGQINLEIDEQNELVITYDDSPSEVDDSEDYEEYDEDEESYEENADDEESEGLSYENREEEY